MYNGSPRLCNPDTIRERLLGMTQEEKDKAYLRFFEVGLLYGGEEFAPFARKCAEYMQVLGEVVMAHIVQSDELKDTYANAFPVTRRLIEILTPDNYGDILNRFIRHMEVNLPRLQKEYAPYKNIDWESECIAIFCNAEKKI